MLSSTASSFPARKSAEFIGNKQSPLLVQIPASVVIGTNTVNYRALSDGRG